MLVVLPQASLVGSAQVDDDGDGAPDTLARGVQVQTGRVPVDPELPTELSEHIAPLLLALDRKDRRYDLTTDLALARRGAEPDLRATRASCSPAASSSSIVPCSADCCSGCSAAADCG